MKKSALIGYTGFIGGNIAKQKKFSDYYNSQNIKTIKGKRYDLIVSAATSAERWRANQNPEKDWTQIKSLLNNLKNVKAKNFILISTVDVYPNPNMADENYLIKPNNIKQAYGKNRFKMELAVKKMFPNLTILRLPQTFGKGLKKNFIYDLIHDNALDFTHKDSLLQFYNLDNLWKDIQKAIIKNIPILNLAVEPIKASEIAKYTLGLNFKTITKNPPLSYNMISRYKKYIYSKNKTLIELKRFILKEKSKIKIAISNLAWDKSEDAKVVQILKRHQIAGIEVAPSKIWINPTKINQKQIEEYKDYWGQNGIKIVATTSLLFGHPELTIFGIKEKREKTLNYLKKMIKLTSWLGAKTMVFGSPKNRLIGKMNKIQVEKIAVNFFKHVGSEAKKYGINFCIEPIPKIYGSDFLTNTKDTLSLVKKINRPNIKVNLDTGAMKINKENVTETIIKALMLIGHTHISEENFGAITNSKSSHNKVSITLKRLKYQDWVSIEMWAKDSEKHLEAIEKSLNIVKKIYE